MNALRALSLASALATLPLAVAHAAGPEDGQWRWSLTAGDSMPADATIQRGSAATSADLGASSGPLAGAGGTVKLDHQRFSDIYGTGMKVGAEISVGESDSLESFARVSFESQPGRAAERVGTLSNPGLGVSAPVYAQFGQLRTWQLAAGERFYFRPDSGLRPYAEADLGVARGNSVNATYSAPDVAVNLGSGQYFKPSTGLLGDAGLGLAYGLAPGMDLSFGVQLEYQVNPSVDGVTLTAAGLPVLSASASHWSYPAHLGISYSF